MVDKHSHNYESMETVYFQRMSVIATDSVLLFAAYKYLMNYKSTVAYSVPLSAVKIYIFALICFHSGLLLVDHIHFQYNGMLIGMLLSCFYFAATQRYIAMTIAFSTLILMKHLFAPLVLVFGLHVLSNYCVYDVANNEFYPITKIITRIVILIVTAMGMLILSFGPIFLSASMFSSYNLMDVLKQIQSRLFPFDRGLVHAYWAPNVWALYCFFDKILFIVNDKYPNLFRSVLSHLPVALSRSIAVRKAVQGNGNKFASTAGLVGEFQFNILQPVSAVTCLGLMVILSLPALYYIARIKSRPIKGQSGSIYVKSDGNVIH